MKVSLPVLVFSFLKVCVALEHVWHSYQYDPIYESREELVITNITSHDDFKLDYVVTKWKNLHVEQLCYLAGIMDDSVVIATLKTNENRDSFEQNSYKIDLENEVVDLALFQFWNTTSLNTEVMLVIGTQNQLLWYAINETNFSLFWSWSLLKNISHINIFQIEYDYRLLIINEYLTHKVADIYEFVPSNPPNLWLHQNLKLNEVASTSIATTAGADYFLAIPQKILHSLLVYKLRGDHFTPFKNISSKGIDDVAAFHVGQKSFLAVNGLQAGIYRFARKDLVKENITESHLDGVNYWLPISLSVYGDDTVLLAQRTLVHGLHKSFVVEIITYNGDKFEEHEDIPCLYFGEEILGLSCLPDDESQKGIRGSAFIFLDDVLALLIPRKNRSSELFLFTVELRKIPNPLFKQIEHLTTERQRLSELMSMQENRYNEFILQNTFDHSAINDQLDEIEQDVRSMKKDVPFKHDNSPHYSTIIFNGLVKIVNSGSFDEIQAEKLNNEPVNILFEDIVLKNDIKRINSSKTLAKLEVEDLMTEKVNNLDSVDLVFHDDNVVINGDIFLTKPMTVSENITATSVNELFFENEVINLDSPVDDLTFEHLEVFGSTSMAKLNNHQLLIQQGLEKFSSDKLISEELFVPFNINVTKINGENFDTFLKELCLKNIKNYIPGSIKLKGNVIVLENTKTDYLNNLRFPGEFVFVDNSSPNITGLKNFTRMSASEVNCDGTIDDISTASLITRTTNQTLPGVTTFKKLKITESLNVDGNITGEHASKFLSNPTLLESNFIKSKVHFKNLHVTGDIIITQNFNGENLELRLSDSVYVNDERPIIGGMKQFPEGFTVRENLLIDSHSINNIRLDSIVTTNTEQNLNLSIIKGLVTFGSVDSEGLYNSIDVKKLDEELVKLFGEQYISSTLIFEDDVIVNKLQVIKSFQNFTADLPTNKGEKVADVEVDNILVEANACGIVDNFDLLNFDKHRLSFTRNQRIDRNFVFDELTVNNMLPRRINSVDLQDFKYESLSKKLTKNLLKGNIAVKNFHVGRSIEIEKVNNGNATNLGGAFWKHDIKKHNLEKLIFTSDVFFDKVNIEKLSGVDFNLYIQNIIFKHETEVNVTGKKSFLKGFTVKKLMETDKINNISLSNVLSKHGAQEILGPITIHGDVRFQNNVTIFENINHIPIRILTEVYEFNDAQFKIKGDVLFNRVAHIRHLQIQGYVDDRVVKDVIDGIIYCDDDFKLDSLMAFENKVIMDKNIRIFGKINNVNFPAFVSDMVMITKDAAIKSYVKFLDEVFVENQIIVHDELTTNDLNGINLKSWVENAVFINEGYLKGNYLFENVRVVDTLRTSYINDVNMKTLIPLRTQQDLPDLGFNEISLFKDVVVGNSTNLCNLPDEFSNSVLVNSNQNIDSDIEFIGNVFIEGDAELLGTVNEIETNRFVTTNTDQDLSAIYNFKSKINLDKNLVVDGLVSGVDIDKWARDSVKVVSQLSQNITDSWFVDSDLILEENSVGNGYINNIDFKKFSQDVQTKRNHKYEVEKGFIDDYKNICTDLTYMYDKLKKQIFKFNYLEEMQTLNFREEIEYVYNYIYRNTTYILVKEKNSCESYLFIFDAGFRYVKSIHSGPIAQIISARDNDMSYLIIRNEPVYSTCKVEGTNLWQLNRDGFVNLVNIEDQDLLQESLEPRTFYGLRNYIVTEFKILPHLDISVVKYRRWEVKEENMAFVPRGLATGLALRTGRKMISLHRDDASVDSFSPEIENIIIGTFKENFNPYFPGRKGSDLVVMKVGIRSTKRNLLAVASHEETSVRGSLDFIKIYEDVNTGKVFHKVPAYKPSSLITLQFNNGETLLAFMEDESTMQVYEYKGIEGFKHKLSAKLQGSKLFAMSLMASKNQRKVIGLVDKNKITFMEVVMLGNKVEENLKCSL